MRTNVELKHGNNLREAEVSMDVAQRCAVAEAARREQSLAGRFGRALVAGVLACGLMIPVAAPTSAYAAEGTAKDEIVYVKGDAAGTSEGIYVVNVFDTDSDETISDPAAYETITNLSTTDSLEQSDGTVSVSTTAGTPFYYQGDLSAASELPWNITVTYYLDGAEVSAEDLAGATGDVKVVFDVQANTDAENVSDFANSYILQAQGTFPEDSFAISDAGDATVARSGSDQVVTCLVLPGESATFEITGDARDFTYDGWQVAGMSLSMAIDLANEDTSQLSEATQELEDATSQLSGGASTLFSGSEDLADGASELADGASATADGAAELSSGVDSAVAGLSQLTDAGTKVANGWESVYKNVQSLADNLTKLAEGSSYYADGLELAASTASSQASGLAEAKQTYSDAAAALQTALNNNNIEAAQTELNTMNEAEQAIESYAYASGAATAYQKAQSSYTEINSSLSAIASGASGLSTGAASFDSGLDSYLSGASSAASQSSTLASGASEVAAATASVADGADQVADATESLAEGASELADGAETLATSVQGMDEEILDELQATIDEKLGAGFEAHSYVVPSNTNVDSVQFVYVLDGVSEPEEESTDSTESDEAETEQTIIDRFFALFTSEE